MDYLKYLAYIKREDPRKYLEIIMPPIAVFYAFIAIMLFFGGIAIREWSGWISVVGIGMLFLEFGFAISFESSYHSYVGWMEAQRDIRINGERMDG